MSRSSIILVHLGTDKPHYIRDCIRQIRLWNNPGEVDIYLVAFPELAEVFGPMCEEYFATFVSTASLTSTKSHKQFLEDYTNYDSTFRTGYWRFVVERFYYMEETMRAFNLKSAIHLEYDVMLYMNLASLQEKFATHIPNMALAFDNDVQGYPSFIVINNIDALELLNGFICVNCNSGLSDMKLLSVFRWIYPALLESLPQISTAMFEANPNRKSLTDTAAKEPPSYLANKFSELGSVIFDSIAIGQYIGGVDPRNADGTCIVEYLNESAFYTIRELGLVWKRDDVGRWYLETGEGGHRVVNMHVHSKMLSYFSSDRAEQPNYHYANVRLAKLLDGPK